MTNQEPEVCTEMTNLLDPKEHHSKDKKVEGGDPELTVKINILNIQRSTKDDIHRNLSSLHIETLQNGTKIGESNHINNNSEVPDIDTAQVTEKATIKHDNVFFVT